MLKRFVASTAVLAALLFSPPTYAQNAPPAKSGAAKDEKAPVDPGELEDHLDCGRSVPRPVPLESLKSSPAPIHDIAGTWEPAVGWRNGVQATGAFNFAKDGRHPEVPYTPLGMQMWKTHKYGDGAGSYSLGEVNDPFEMCDPIGFPRVDLHDLRAIQIVPAKGKLLVTYENNQVWRTIWADGREFPKITEARWYGYSIGKWVDDTTFVVETRGMDERTWIDNVGRPHTADLRVEERFHRVSHDLMELTLTIIDPSLYTQPWNALDKYPLRLQPDSFDVREMICSASEAAEYNKLVGEQTLKEKK